MGHSLNTLFRYLTINILSPGTVLKEKYEAFKLLLEMDQKAHEFMVDIEDIYYRHRRVDQACVEVKYESLSRAVATMVECLYRMSPPGYGNLRDYFRKIDISIRFILSPGKKDESPPYAITIDKLDEERQKLAGGKGGNLATLTRRLRLPCPRGFVITTNAFYRFMAYNGLEDRIRDHLARLDISKTACLEATSAKIMGLIRASRVPPDVEVEISSIIHSLWDSGRRETRLAVRSSAVAEDTNSSFAGQYLTLLNVKPENCIWAYKEILASKYLPTALCYRIHYGLSDAETPMAVLVFETIDSMSSGVIYTMDLDGRRKDILVINSIWGMGELLVGGRTSADIFRFRKVRPPELLSANPGHKPVKMICGRSEDLEIVRVREDQQRALSLSEDDAMRLASWAMDTEEHYGRAQDMEWCQDHQGRLFILQARPLNIDGEDERKAPAPADIPNEVLLSGGHPASPGTGFGKVFRLNRLSDLELVPSGVILVAREAPPYFMAIMDRINAIVTDLGSTESHLASVAREFGIPLLVNTEKATSVLPDGQEVTVHADNRTVYRGKAEVLLDAVGTTKKNPFEQSPLMTRLKSMMGFVAQLRMIDPDSPDFVPESCRSLHDIIRFVHEKAVSEMFLTGGGRRGGTARGGKKLISDLPILFYVFDVGGGLVPGAENRKEVTIEDVLSNPMKAVWKGLTDPGIKWSEFEHFAWEDYDNIMLSGGVISRASPSLASFAIVSEDYLNLSIRFGYHFVIVDALCRRDFHGNYIMFRFNGGGGDISGRLLRARFLKEVLEQNGFKVETRGDLIDARIQEQPRGSICEKLIWVGRLLGATRLMDMYLKNPEDVSKYVSEFLNGKSYFVAEGE